MQINLLLKYSSKKWRGRFVRGQETFEDDPREGKPMRNKEDKYDEKTMKIIEEYRCNSVEEIKNILEGLNTKTRNYLKKIFILKSICANGFLKFLQIIKKLAE